MEATYSAANEAPNLTCSSLSGVNRGYICNGLAILASPCAADWVSSIRCYLVGESSSSCQVHSIPLPLVGYH